MRAATIYCRKFLDPFQLPTGQSYPYKISQIPCEEDTSLCDFYGNLRNDRDNGNVPAGYTFMDYDKCMEFMPTIFTACGGNGGWVNTDYGTVFAECIQVKS
ncbi:hypothetical protein BDV95DRAFT_567210 [Massariosphaeria phaeospora]|uniref:Uncharacterized protein n=1 Tax=Massariosphaeria phaeospora TaxID=100035 RepID=A0A7C8IGC6_9PLEO|nr:hypothetical protein BDV95DRAFT_567210 [Massariosphaeria phaeospora]